MKVHVITAYCGEYSDQIHWTVCVLMDAAAAMSYADEANRISQENEDHFCEEIQKWRAKGTIGPFPERRKNPMDPIATARSEQAYYGVETVDAMDFDPAPKVDPEDVGF